MEREIFSQTRLKYRAGVCGRLQFFPMLYSDSCDAMMPASLIGSYNVLIVEPCNLPGIA